MGFAPVRPGKIVGVGLNYRAHAAEMAKPLPTEPLLFLKPPSAWLAPEQPIVLPPGYQRIDYEGEVGVVIGKQARRVAAQTVSQYIAGVTCAGDITVRDLQKRDVQYTRAKGFDTFCPAGPTVVDGLDLRNLRLRTRVNGQVRQDGSTSDLIFDIPFLVSFISHVMTLEPGDLIVTGTPPGVGPLHAGDVLEIEIDGVGVLRNPVVEDSQ